MIIFNILKQYIPLAFKRIAWYIFKSHQRKIGWVSSWGTEIAGNLYFLAKLADRSSLQPVSICTGIKNRSENYLNSVLSSVIEMDHSELVELSIYDCGSEDFTRFEAALDQNWKGKLKLTYSHEEFTRSSSFNQAIRQSTHPLIFACDADMLLPKDLVQEINRFVSRKTVWFPICFWLDKDKAARIAPEHGHWHPVGKGMFASSRKQFDEIGGFDENYITWGGEDWDIWLRFWKAGFYPVRTKCQGLFHRWHPSLKPDKE